MLNKLNFSQLLNFLFHIIIIVFIWLLLKNCFIKTLLCDSGDSSTLYDIDDNSIESLGKLENSLSKQYKKYRIVLDDYNRYVKIHNVMLYEKIEGRAFYYKALSRNVELKYELARVRRLEEKIKKIDPNFKLITRKQLFERGNWFRKIFDTI